MKHRSVLPMLLMVAGCSSDGGFSTVEYQGESFHLTRPFDDYDQYKETPDNLEPAEIDRIESRMLAVPIQREFESKKEFIRAAMKIKFPGYGAGSLRSPENIHTETFEIPQKVAYRYITAVERNGRWHVADDFKGPIAYGGTTVEIADGQLVYKSWKGVEFRRRPLD